MKMAKKPGAAPVDRIVWGRTRNIAQAMLKNDKMSFSFLFRLESMTVRNLAPSTSGS